MNIIKIIAKTLLVASLVWMPYIIQAQQTYYVSTQGNNNNSGTSPSQAWKTIQKACNEATPGSTVIVSDGVYNEQPVLHVSGTAGNPIRFVAEHPLSVLIDGTGLGGGAMLTIINQSHLEFNGFAIKNLIRNFGIGILVETTTDGAIDDIRFSNLDIAHINWTNDPTAMPGPGNNSNPFLFYGQGITPQNAISGIVIDSCEIHDNITGYSESLTCNGNVNGVTIRGCTIHHNKNIGICIAGNYNACSVPELDHASNVHILGNKVYYNISPVATSAGIYVDGGRKALIERNLCYHNGVGIEIGCERDGLTDSCIVRNNIVAGNLDWGIGVGGYDPSTTGLVTFTRVENNTLYSNTVNNSGMGEFYMPKASHCVFQNNIVYTSQQNIIYTFDNIDPQTDNTFDYNCWYATGGNAASAQVNYRGSYVYGLQEFNTLTGFDEHSMFKSPAFYDSIVPQSNFTLKTGSACIDAANPDYVPEIDELDYRGEARQFNNRVDIGACEYSGTNAVNHPTTGYAPLYYPNPVSDKLFVKHLQCETTYKVLSVGGLVIKSGGYNDTGIDLAAVSNGLYLIEIDKDISKIYSFWVVVQH